MTAQGLDNYESEAMLLMRRETAFAIFLLVYLVTLNPIFFVCNVAGVIVIKVGDVMRL